MTENGQPKKIRLPSTVLRQGVSMELIKPQKQQVWKLPAVLNFTFGGLGAGMYIAAWLANTPEKGEWISFFLADNANWLSIALPSAMFKLLAPALVALGFIALTTEAGRPQRGINLFRHLRRSWMSRETLAFAIFAPLAGLDWIFPNAVVRALAVIAALALVTCQGMIVYRARGVMTWNIELMPWYFVAASWSSGAGLYVLIAAALNVFVPNQIIFFAITGALVNTAVWLMYVFTSDGYFRDALRDLRAWDSLALVVGVGQALPALLLGIIAFSKLDFENMLIAAAGACLIAGAFVQKFGIILRVGYLRAIVLNVA